MRLDLRKIKYTDLPIYSIYIYMNLYILLGIVLAVAFLMMNAWDTFVTTQWAKCNGLSDKDCQATQGCSLGMGGTDHRCGSSSFMHRYPQIGSLM